jgi:3',5'-cyclic-AMP phosphodiesterase
MADPLQTDPSLNLREDSTDEPFRFVFLPDIHLRDGYGAAEGMAACLKAVEALEPRPAFLLTGGDLCDGMGELTMEEATARAERFVEIWRENTTVPAYHCLGNHDMAAWSRDDADREHPQFGMRLMMDKLGMERLYYSFDCGRWHFVILDSVYCEEPGEFKGRVSEEQLEWLREDLRQHREQPAIVICHIPPVTAADFFSGRPQKAEDEWQLSFMLVMDNPADLSEALKEGDVKATLSGHLHHLERIETLGRAFFCAGTVSAHKWEEVRLETRPGFSIFDCHPDGTFTHEYHEYGWEIGQK